MSGQHLRSMPFDILRGVGCFWREGEQTSLEVITGDPKLVERCDLVSKITQLRTASDPI